MKNTHVFTEKSKYGAKIDLKKGKREIIHKKKQNNITSMNCFAKNGRIFLWNNLY